MAGVFIYRFWQFLFHVLIAIGWFRWRVEGLENLPPRESGGMVIAMNHIHWLDIFAVGVLLPFDYRLTWLGKSELFQNPLASWYFRNMQVVPVQRGKRDLAALQTSIELLKDGAVMLIFPEGHRSKTGMLQQGRNGAIRIAARSGVPIVPAAIIGTQHKLSGTLKRKQVVLRIGTPYTIEPAANGKIPSDMMTELTNEMMQRIAAMLPPEYHGYYRNEAAMQETTVAETPSL
jgi:1-acyl-sn-glycerol-3-phosphate acyltransferase